MCSHEHAQVQGWICNTAKQDNKRQGALINAPRAMCFLLVKWCINVINGQGTLLF